MSFAKHNFCNPENLIRCIRHVTSMVSNKQENNSGTFSFTHTHLFSVGFFDKGSFLSVALTLSAPGRGYFTVLGNVIECYR